MSVQRHKCPGHPDTEPVTKTGKKVQSRDKRHKTAGYSLKENTQECMHEMPAEKELIKICFLVWMVVGCAAGGDDPGILHLPPRGQHHLLMHSLKIGDFAVSLPNKKNHFFSGGQI